MRLSLDSRRPERTASPSPEGEAKRRGMDLRPQIDALKEQAHGVVNRVRSLKRESRSSPRASSDNSETKSDTGSSQKEKPMQYKEKAAAKPVDADKPPVAPPTVSSLLGKNVLLFSPDDDMTVVQSQLDVLYAQQKNNQFGTERYAFFFKPGHYKLDIKVGYYTTVHGLGLVPEDTIIEGAVRSLAALEDHNATINFWRGVENLTVIPTLKEDDDKLIWATSQGTWLRRVQVKGDLNLSDHDGWCSGGYISDSLVTGEVNNSTQQQYFMRGSYVGSWIGGNYAQVFVGVENAPEEDWPAKPYSTVKQTPIIREKPYFIQDPKRGGDGDDDSGDDATGDKDVKYSIVVPGLRTNSRGPSWAAGDDRNKNGTRTIPLSDWLVVQPGNFDIDQINSALKTGKNILFTPGNYELTRAIEVVAANTVVMGFGLATLKPVNGTAAVTVDDVDGVTVTGLLLDAGSNDSSALLLIGDAKSSKRHQENPIVASDILCRVGGVTSDATRCSTMITINPADTIVDHTWCWRADHNDGVGWNTNRCNTGFLVEANDVTVYGLFVEHCNQYQTVWNGQRGKVYFYQSELPYDPPDVQQWSHSGTQGYASYKVAPSVQTHYVTGLGVYCVFPSAPIKAFTAIEHPIVKDWWGTPQVLVRHAATARFGGDEGSGIEHIINALGDAVDSKNQRKFIKSAYE